MKNKVKTLSLLDIFKLFKSEDKTVAFLENKEMIE